MQVWIVSLGFENTLQAHGEDTATGVALCVVNPWKTWKVPQFTHHIPVSEQGLPVNGPLQPTAGLS